MSYSPKVFNKDDIDGWKEFLEEEGYVVLGDILTSEEMLEGIELFWKDFTTVSPEFKRYDTSTWSIKTAPLMFAKGMAIFSGFGQSDFMWNLRLKPQIIEIFEKIHNTKELLTSFDGYSVFFSKTQKTKPWWHVDQHPKSTVKCIQGAYNFLPVTETAAGFTVIPKSHKTLKIKQDDDTVAGKDWIVIPSDNPILNQGIKLIIPANCFVLWNSHIVHANVGISKTVPKNTPEKLDRLTAFITYLPKSTRIATQQRKINAYKNGETTSHWGNKCEIKLYPWGFGPQYEKKNFTRLLPKIDTDNNIPAERLAYI